MYNNNNNNFSYQQQMQQMQFQMNSMNLNNNNNNNSNNNNNNNFGYNNNNNNSNNCNQYNANNVNNNNNNYCMTQQQRQLYLRQQQMCQQNNNMNNNMNSNNMNNMNNNYISQCKQYQYAQNQKAQQELQKKIDALQRQINQAKQLQAYQYQLQQRQQQQMKMGQHQQMNKMNNQQMNNQYQYQQCREYQQRQQQLQKQQSQNGYPYQQQQEQHTNSDHDDSMSDHSIHSSSSQCISPSMIPSPSVTPTPTPTDDTVSTISTASFTTDASSEDNNNNYTFNDNNNKPKTYKHRTSSKLQASLRWIIYNDQIDDYADMLCLNDELKIYVINQCSKHSATHSACIKWSKKWNLINHPQCQRAIYHAMSQSKINKKHEQKSNKKPKSSDIKGFDDLPICTIDAVKDVIFVNNQATLNIAKEILLSERKYIGLDLECVVKEFPIHNAPKYCQILQVATSTKTIVFDLQAIPSKYSPDTDGINNKNRIDPKEFDDVLYTIFYDSNVLKIGMSFDSDLKLLRKQYPFLKCFKCIIKSYFELEKVLSYLRTVSGQEIFNIDMMKENQIKKKLAKTNTKREGGLPTIVRHILKQRLMKKEQLSNWARRPLRISQLQYASIDAKIQLIIYDTLHSNYNKLLNNKTKSWVKDLSRY